MSRTHTKNYSKDFNKSVDYEKDVDIDVKVETSQEHETKLRVDKDINVDIDVDVDLDLDGNSAVLAGHSESVSDKWMLVSDNTFGGSDSMNKSWVTTDTFVFNSADSKLGSNLIANGYADGTKSYAELVYTFNFDDKGLTEIIVEGEAHGVH